jgi:hypothetical protein
MMLFFGVSRSFAEAIDAGFRREELTEALETGLLVDMVSDPSADAWETCRWSRAAYLHLSQLDTPYLEGGSTPEAAELTRRETLANYESEGPYPQATRNQAGPSLLLRSGDGVRTDLGALFERRSPYRFSPEPITSAELGSTLWRGFVYARVAAQERATGGGVAYLKSYASWLRVLVCALAVDGLSRAVYEYDIAEGSLTAIGPCSEEDVASAIQDQPWGFGGGVGIFLCAQWERYQWTYRNSRAYTALLISAGRVGQELVQAAVSAGLACRMTPAVAETSSSKLLDLDATACDPVYFVRIGHPSP